MTLTVTRVYSSICASRLSEPVLPALPNHYICVSNTPAPLGATVSLLRATTSLLYPGGPRDSSRNDPQTRQSSNDGSYTGISVCWGASAWLVSRCVLSSEYCLIIDGVQVQLDIVSPFSHLRQRHCAHTLMLKLVVEPRHRFANVQPCP